MKNSGIILKTNPLLTGNVKIYVADKMYLDSISTSSMSNSNFKRIPINPNSTLEIDVSRFFGNNVSSEEIYANPKIDVTTKVDRESDVINQTYISGVSRNRNPDSFEFSFFAPLYLGKKIPNFFAVFRCDIDEPKETMIKNSEIVHINDMRDHTDLGSYIRKYHKNLVSNNIDIDIKNSKITYHGVDLITGVLSYCEEHSPIFDKEMTQIDMDKYIIQGYYRNRMLYPNIINMEFGFNDDKKYSRHKYFAFYMDDLDISSVYTDILEDEYVKFNEGNRIVDKIHINKVNGIWYEEEQTSNGILMPYIKDTNNLPHRVYDINGNILDIKNQIPSSLFDGFDRPQYIQSDLIESTKSVCYITIKNQFNIGDRISYWKHGKEICFIIADNLATYTGTYGPGKSHGHYFYPYGSIEEITEAISSAFNSTFADFNISCLSEFKENIVFLSEDYFDESYIKYRMEEDSMDVTPFYKETHNFTSFTIPKNATIENYPYVLTEQGYAKVYDRRLNFTDEFTEIVSSIDKPKKILKDVLIYYPKSLPIGYFKFFEVYNIDSDLYDDIDSINLEVDSFRSIYQNDIEIQKFDKLSSYPSAYRRFKEDLWPSNVTTIIDSVIPKFVKEELDVKSMPYRFNTNLSFGELNLSPAMDEKISNPLKYTHEFFIISGLPQNIAISNDYVEYFDRQLFDSNTNDYFYQIFAKNNKKLYSEVSIRNGRYFVFFRGIEMELKSTSNIEGYKFAAILSTRRTKLNEIDKPIKLDLLENKKYKTMVLHLEVLCDDYKNEDFSYYYLYIMQSIVNDGKFGYRIDLPTLTGIDIVDEDDQTMDHFYGAQFASNFNYVAPDSKAYVDLYPYIEMSYKNDSNGNILGMIGIKNNNIVATFKDLYDSTNGFYKIMTPSIKSFDSFSIHFDNLAMGIVNLDGIIIQNNIDVYQFDNFYSKLKNLIWYTYNGGYKHYEEIVKLISFSNIVDIVQNVDPIFENHTDIQIYFEKPKKIELTTSKLVAIKIEENDIPDIVYDYKLEPDAITTIYRYDGLFDIKLDKILQYDSMNIPLRFGNAIGSFSELNDDFDVENVNSNSDIFANFGIPNLNREIGMWYRKMGNWQPMSKNPIYLGIDIAVDKTNVFPFGRFLIPYYNDNTNILYRLPTNEFKFMMASEFIPIESDINVVADFIQFYDNKITLDPYTCRNYLLEKSSDIEISDKLFGMFEISSVLLYHKRNFLDHNRYVKLDNYDNFKQLRDFKFDNFEISYDSQFAIGYDMAVIIHFKYKANK